MYSSNLSLISRHHHNHSPPPKILGVFFSNPPSNPCDFHTSMGSFPSSAFAHSTNAWIFTAHARLHVHRRHQGLRGLNGNGNGGGTFLEISGTPWGKNLIGAFVCEKTGVACGRCKSKNFFWKKNAEHLWHEALKLILKNKGFPSSLQNLEDQSPETT